MKLMNRFMKAYVIRLKHGRTAESRYLKSCAYYDAARSVGLKGIDAWMLKNCNFKPRNLKNRQQPARSRNMMWLMIASGLLASPLLIVTVPLYLLSKRTR